ncbi:peptidase M6 [Halocatena pleomorpha]|uniref:Peptidase M6 n=1 Tax=Halocatena pleomorpha TaxID=1785090 RepID=A0A3P3RF95_9EURY|nr:peptidase M6 [Halocatena pleomorpha]
MLLAAVLVVSAAAVGTGGGAVPQMDDENHRQTTVQSSNQLVNNSSQSPRPVEPSQEALEKPVHLESASDTADRTTAASDTASEGATRQFPTSRPNGYTFETFTLRGVGDNIEVWVANDMSWPDGDPRPTPSISDAQVDHLVSEFDTTIHPTESELFGTPTPRDGNNSPVANQTELPDDYYHTTENAGNKTVLLVTNIRDENYNDPEYPVYTAGYYSPTVQSYTDRNVITVDSAEWNAINESNQRVGVEGTFAHEYQHLIHGDYDGDETSWINEGMADFAEYAVGYGVPDGHVGAYEQLPSNSLTNWGDQGDINILADYGEAYLFQMYLTDRYGSGFISDLFKEKKNGIAGVEQTLDEYGADTDFYHLYQDFATAAVLDGRNQPPNDRYDIDGVDLNVNTSRNVKTAGAWGTAYQTYDTAGKGPITDVNVSGTDYIGTQWNTTTDPVDGEGQVLHSGSGNLLDRFAIVEANVSERDPTLSFETYYDIEQNWDYGFVQVSTDGGETWESLSNENTVSTTADGAHPTVKGNVPGFTGQSEGWTNQTFDLSDYAGEEVLISFRYATDWATNNDGWYVRNVSVGGQHHDGTTTGPFMSQREATERPVEYQFTFIGIKHNGNYKVKQLDTRTFTESDKRDLRQFLHNGNFERVTVAATWAANSGESGRVPVDVGLTFQHENRNHSKR